MIVAKLSKENNTLSIKTISRTVQLVRVGKRGPSGHGVPDGGNTGQVLAKASDDNQDTEWVDQTGGGGGGAVDSVNGQTGVVILDSDDIGDTSATHKFVTASDITKLSNLSGINTGDQNLSGLVPKTTTVNGHALSSNVTVIKSDVGLANVDNTSDANKPVSAATQTALNSKADISSIPNKTSQLTNDSGFITGYTETDPIFTSHAAHNITSADITKLDNLSGVNTGDQVNITGNAGTATKLATARNINGIPFDGSSNITVADNTKVPTTTTVNGHTLSTDVVVTANDVLPTQTGNSGKFLTTDGEDASWEAIPGGGDMLATTYDPNSVAADAFDYDNFQNTPTLGTAAAADVEDFATATQGSMADTAVQPGDLATVATTGDYGDLSGTPSIPSTTAGLPDSTNRRYVTDAQLTVLGNTSGTNTGDQTSVTGNAGTATALQTTRNIDGQAFNGTTDITVIAPATHAATSKSTPADADEFPFSDSAASNVLKKLTWANMKATLKAYFDSFYQVAGTYLTPSSTNTLTNKDLTSGTNTFPTFNQNTTGSAAKLTTARNIAGVAFDGTSAISLTSGSAIQKGNGSGGFSSAVAGTDYLAFSGLAKITVSTTSPSSPTTGDLWVDTN